ncbi:hypothetical protein FAI41_07355 [Acetobacteraceae bacterium]|nr:hypothetical protein FAI41_07355 [Acetobacteraceae bacterium]
MQQQAPHILIFGLSGACAQSALIHLSQSIPNAIFTGWSRTPQKIPSHLRQLCREIKSGEIADIHSKEIFKEFDLIIFTPPAKFLPKILQLSHCPLVALGSTRKFTKWPDAYAFEVLTAEKLLFADKRPAFFLHPTMIFGDENNQNISKLGKIIKKFKILPLPKSGKYLVQPIHYDDVGKALAEAAKLLLLRVETSPCSLIITGAQAFSYQDLIHLLSKAQNLSRRFILPLPLPCLLFFSFTFRKITKFFPKLTAYIPSPEAIRRLTEDKDFSFTEMEEILGFSPTALNAENWQKKLCLKRQRINFPKRKEWGE